MKKIKLLIHNKTRLILFLVLSVVVLCATWMIPFSQWAKATVIDQGIVSIRGVSMEPTIPNNTIMYVGDLTFERGSVVVVKNHSTLKYSASKYPTLLKRIVGLPGETVEIAEEGVLINGKLLDEPYCESAKDTLQESNDIQEIVLSDNEYFVLGDNRIESFDSRHVGAFNRSEFLYELTPEPNEYTKMIERKQRITFIVVLSITILTPIIMFFLCTIQLPKRKNVKVVDKKDNQKSIKKNNKK